MKHLSWRARVFMCFLQTAILQARSHRIPTAEAKKTAGFAAMVLKNPIELGDNAKISQDPTIPSKFTSLAILCCFPSPKPLKHVETSRTFFLLCHRPRSKEHFGFLRWGLLRRLRRGPICSGLWDSSATLQEGPGDGFLSRKRLQTPRSAPEQDHWGFYKFNYTCIYIYH